jgi:hypothetical protein
LHFINWISHLVSTGRMATCNEFGAVW